MTTRTDREVIEELVEALDDAVFNLRAAAHVINKHDARALKAVILAGQTAITNAKEHMR